MHLPGERSKIHEALLLPQLLDELNFNLAPVEVAGKIEDMRLEEGLCAPNRRTRAQACHSRQGLHSCAAHAHGKNPGERRALAMQLHVGGGESKLAPQMSPVHDASDHRIGPAEPAFGVRKIAPP